MPELELGLDVRDPFTFEPPRPVAPPVQQQPVSIVPVGPPRLPRIIEDLPPASTDFGRTRRLLETMPEVFDDPATQLLESFSRERFAGLLEPPFTGTQETARRAARFENLEANRAATRQQVLERLGAAGHGQGSGTIEQALQLVDNQFNRLRQEGERDLMLEGIGRRDTNLDKALALAALLPELEERRLHLGLSAAGGGAPSPGSLFQQLASLAGQTTQQQALAAQQRGSSMSGLGQLIGLLLTGGMGGGGGLGRMLPGLGMPAGAGFGLIG